MNLQNSKYQNAFTSKMENSVDLDQIASQQPAELVQLDLHCFQNKLWHYNNNSLFPPIRRVHNTKEHIRLVVIFQETARNHFWEAWMLMQSYMLETVQ